MQSTLSTLIKRLSDPKLRNANVIRWGCPVPSFGDLTSSKVATLGLNPSNREFVDIEGKELDGASRRFHTLKSLELDRWADIGAKHLRMIAESCSAYFSRNPYDGWFRKLDRVISGTKASYYDALNSACHLDLIPYATACKWTELSHRQRSTLFHTAGDTLGLLLKNSPIRILILNGNSVVQNFQKTSGCQLEKKSMRSWSLPRKTKPNVTGIAYQGCIRSFCGSRLQNEIVVLGFNHNIQSSFGVTTHVTEEIRYWISEKSSKVLS
jgi:hypothetical protein